MEVGEGLSTSYLLIARFMLGLGTLVVVVEIYYLVETIKSPVSTEYAEETGQNQVKLSNGNEDPPHFHADWRAGSVLRYMKELVGTSICREIPIDNTSACNSFADLRATIIDDLDKHEDITHSRPEIMHGLVDVDLACHREDWQVVSILKYIKEPNRATVGNKSQHDDSWAPNSFVETAKECFSAADSMDDVVAEKQLQEVSDLGKRFFGKFCLHFEGPLLSKDYSLNAVNVDAEHFGEHCVEAVEAVGCARLHQPSPKRRKT